MVLCVCLHRVGKYRIFSKIFNIFSKADILVDGIENDENETEADNGAHNEAIAPFSHRNAINQSVHHWKFGRQVQHSTVYVLVQTALTTQRVLRRQSNTYRRICQFCRTEKCFTTQKMKTFLKVSRDFK